MEQFRKWQEKREVKTIGYLNNSSAYKAGEEAGWQAALKWALEQEEWQGTDDCGCWGVSKYDIKEELGDI